MERVELGVTRHQRESYRLRLNVGIAEYSLVKN
jgi:hypothetical protein